MTRPTVAVVDYTMGNLFSVARAAEHAGLVPSIAESPAALRGADGIILTGVGSMQEAMRVLTERGLADGLRNAVARGVPILGVCLGMQLLMTRGTEFGEHAGLGIVDGEVLKFPEFERDGTLRRIPHIGWNSVRLGHGGSKSPAPPPLRVDGEFYYFVHSFYVRPVDPSIVLAETAYGDVTFCSAYAYGSILAVQFHPERSGPAGLDVYRDFAKRLT